MLGNGVNSLLFNDFKNQEYNDYQIKTKDLLNQTQIKSLKNKTQNANYLIKYFEGTILNYISLYEAEGKRMNEFKNLILSNEYKNKFEGGYEENDYIKNHPQYCNYKNDINEIKTIFKDEDWSKIEFEININYQKEYNIHIKHNKNGLNKIDLIIDLQHNAIIDNIKESCNNNIYDNSLNINSIIEKLIKILIEYIYKIDSFQIELLTNINDKHSINKDYYSVEVLIKGIISLLIIILTLKNNTDPNIYKTYNSTFLLSAICKHKLINDVNDMYYDLSQDIFAGNNEHLLTYDEKNNEIKFMGDCALNVLMCANNSDIRKLFIDKLNYSQNNYKYNNETAKAYVEYIKKVLEKIPTIEKELNFKKLINDCVDEYYTFIQFITGDKYIKFKNEVRNNNNLNINCINNFTKIYNYCLKFVNVLRNNLLDFNFTNNEHIIMFDDLCENLGIIERILYRDPNFINYIGASFKLIEIIDNILKIGKNSFNMFYINLLISLLLIQHKIDYMFNDNIMNILKYSKNKENIIKCFRNICHNGMELGMVFPTYQDDKNNNKYLFIFTEIQNANHAVLSIININKSSTKKIYLYDINRLIMYYSEIMDIKKFNLFNGKNIYPLNQNPQRWIMKIIKNISKIYEKEVILEFNNINRLANYHYCNNYFINYIKKSSNSNKLNIYDKRGNLKIDKLNNLNYIKCNEKNFKSLYSDVKTIIFKSFSNYCNILESEYKNNNNKLYLSIIQHIKYDINKNIINDDYKIKELLFKFIKCLINTKCIIENKNDKDHLYDEYKIVGKYFIDSYEIDTQQFIKYLNFNDEQFNNEIAKIINILNFKYDNINIVHGGNVSINYNNTIIKRVLIILLVIIIIIIIVLIVLYIINKYKNNKIVP